MRDSSFSRRLAAEEGFGLLELLISIVVLTVAVGALFAVFGAGALSVARSGREGTATAIVDHDLEYYRRAPWYDIRLIKSGTDSTGRHGGDNDSTVTGDSVYTGQCLTADRCLATGGGISSVKVDEDQNTNDPNTYADPNLTHPTQDGTCNGALPWTDTAGDYVSEPATAPITNCLAEYTAVGADGKNYRVYTYIRYACTRGHSTCSGNTNVDHNTKIITVIVRLLDSGYVIHSSGSDGLLAKQTETFNLQDYTTCDNSAGSTRPCPS